MIGVIKTTMKSTIQKPTATKTTATTATAGADVATHDAFFAEPIDPVLEGRERGLEVIRHLLIWMSDAPTMEKRGVRATVALYCLRPDLVGGVTLQQIGEQAGCTPQAIHKVAGDFRHNMGLEAQ